LTLYHVAITQETTIEYVVDFDKPLFTPDEFLDFFNKNQLSIKEFSQNSTDPYVSSCNKMTREEYLKYFDEQYPAFKDVDIAMKMYQVYEYRPDDDVVDNVESIVKFDDDREMI
jgi:hypothetical protein